MQVGDLVKVSYYSIPSISDRVCILLDTFTSENYFGKNSRHRVSIIALSHEGEFIKYDLQESWVYKI